MKVKITDGRYIGEGEPCFIVAEMSANHNQDYDKAVKIIKAASTAGADAIKLQTYTPDTITIDNQDSLFRISEDSTWAGKNLYKLYEEAYTPWEWQPELKKIAEDLGLICFSSPFDKTAIDFLEKMGVPMHKIASFELVDLPLIRYAAQKGKPLIMSTGMATLYEIDDAVKAIEDVGNRQMVLLKCVSAYPALPEEMNIRTIPDLKERFKCPVGLSDHTLGHEVALAAVTLGANVIEKHFTLSKKDGGPDSSFSMEPDDFTAMVKAIRLVEKALGKVSYEPTEKELISKQFRRSLFVVKDVKKGERLTMDNVRSIRPSAGLMPKYLDDIIGREASCNIKAGSPLKFDYIK
ncbi:MAG: pseudaminic acid synthase [Thermodesulfobacteriota bacterium]|nr:pseudaminic acid synthase [Thermodesulfobacteriota bacterium]